MTKKRLEMLKEVEELRRVEAVKQYKECEQEIKKHIEDIIGMDNVKVTRVSDNYENWSLEVSVVDEKEERIFGADLDLYYYKKDVRDYHKKGIEVNYGTCGSFNKNDKPQVDKVLMIAKVLESAEEIEAVFENLKTDKIEALDEARREISLAEGELRSDYRKNVENELAVDKTFGGYTITKITPKYVTYKDVNGFEEKERKEDFVRQEVNRLMRQLEEEV